MINIDKRMRVGLRIPYDLNTKLIDISRTQGISKNALILNILWGWLENEEGKK